MKTLLPLVTMSSLFDGVEPEELLPLLEGCLDGRAKNFKKSQTVVRMGSEANRMGIVLKGRVHIEQNDFWGNRSILSSLGPGGIFGESVICSGKERMPVSVIAQEESLILLISCKKLMTTCSHNCARHQRLIQNLLGLLSRKNLSLTQKLEHLTKKSTREKVLSYLSEQAALRNASSFTIPFNRQELADYLSVDRSALSSTLSKLADEGVIAFRKNQFSLLN